MRGELRIGLGAEAIDGTLSVGFAMNSRSHLAPILLLSIGLSGVPAHAQCPEGGPRDFGQRHRDALGGALIGAPIGAAGGALVGMVLPLIFCNAGVGEGGCQAAWIGTGVVALGGWLLGTTMGAALSLEPVGGEVGAAAGFGVLAGGLLFAGGAGLEALTDEPAFFAVSFGLWALGSLFVTPLAMAALGEDRGCAGLTTAPLGFRF